MIAIIPKIRAKSVIIGPPFQRAGVISGIPAASLRPLAATSRYFDKPLAGRNRFLGSRNSIRIFARTARGAQLLPGIPVESFSPGFVTIRRLGNRNQRDFDSRRHEYSNSNVGSAGCVAGKIELKNPVDFKERTC